MSKDNIKDWGREKTIHDPLTALLKTGAKALIQQAVEVELQAFMEDYSHVTDLRGRQTVVRNGYLPEREIVTGDSFLRDFEAKYPKATNLLKKDRESLLAFYDFPAEHWIHIRTTNPIESSFATIRHRTTRTKNCVWRDALMGLVFQLVLTAEKGWRKIRGFKRLPEVIEGILFQDNIAVVTESGKINEMQQIAA